MDYYLRNNFRQGQISLYKQKFSWTYFAKICKLMLLISRDTLAWWYCYNKILFIPELCKSCCAWLYWPLTQTCIYRSEPCGIRLRPAQHKKEKEKKESKNGHTPCCQGKTNAATGLRFTTSRFLLNSKGSKCQGGHSKNNKQNTLEMKQNCLTYSENPQMY